jgi:hypothetical protein
VGWSFSIEFLVEGLIKAIRLIQWGNIINLGVKGWSLNSNSVINVSPRILVLHYYLACFNDSLSSLIFRFHIYILIDIIDFGGGSPWIDIIFLDRLNISFNNLITLKRKLALKSNKTLRILGGIKV